MFSNVCVQCSSLKSSHPLLLPPSPKVSSLGLPAWEHYAALERREILTHAAARMNREDIVPRERSQTQQDSVAQSHFHEVPTFVRFAETEDTMVAAVAMRGGVENSCLMATEFQLWVLKQFWRWLVVIVTQHHIVNVFNAAEVCT